MQINDNIKLIRELSGMKQEEFAKLIKTNVSNLKTYENTDVKPKANVQARIAGYGASPSITCFSREGIVGKFILR